MALTTRQLAEQLQQMMRKYPHVADQTIGMADYEQGGFEASAVE